MIVRLLTEEQKDQLVGQTYDGVQYFNPTLDAEGNWFELTTKGAKDCQAIFNGFSV